MLERLELWSYTPYHPHAPPRHYTTSELEKCGSFLIILQETKLNAFQILTYPRQWWLLHYFCCKVILLPSYHCWWYLPIGIPHLQPNWFYSLISSAKIFSDHFPEIIIYQSLDSRPLLQFIYFLNTKVSVFSFPSLGFILQQYLWYSD